MGRKKKIKYYVMGGLATIVFFSFIFIVGSTTLISDTKINTTGNMYSANITASGEFYGTLNASYVSNNPWIEDGSEGNLNVNSSSFWDSYDLPANLTNLILSHWDNITNKPANLDVDSTNDLTTATAWTGDLGGTGGSPTVDDNSHTHACQNITGAASNLCTLTDTDTTNCSAANSCTNIIYETELDDISELNTQIADATFYDVCAASTARVAADCVDILTEEELNTFSELNTQIADVTLLKSGGTLTNAKWCIYDGSGIDCNVEPVTDTNANTVCSGETVYMDGEGNCDNISAVYLALGGGTMTGNIDMNWQYISDLEELYVNTMHKTVPGTAIGFSDGIDMNTWSIIEASDVNASAFYDDGELLQTVAAEDNSYSTSNDLSDIVHNYSSSTATSTWLTIVDISSATHLISGTVIGKIFGKINLTIDGTETMYSVNKQFSVTGGNDGYIFVIPPIKADSSLKVEIYCSSNNEQVSWSIWTKT